MNNNKLIKRIAVFLAMIITIFSFPFTNIGYAEANFSEPENKYIAEITDNIKTHYNIEISISNK